MAKGKSSRPLTVLAHESLRDHAELTALVLKGSRVVWYGLPTRGFKVEQADPYDLIIGPNCWRIVPGMEDQQLPLAIKAARREKFGTKEERGDENTVEF